MQMIVCLDDQAGMCFNRRRQSRDRVVTDKICDIVGNKTLYINEYSSSLFTEKDVSVNASEDYLRNAADADGVAFIERDSVDAVLEKVHTLYVFRWNRDYPADMSFPLESFAEILTIKEICEFPGNSHEKITLEVYKK